MGLQNFSLTKNSRRVVIARAPASRLETLAYRLSETLRGRENHAALVSLACEWNRAAGNALLSWSDEFTGQSGWLGSLQPEEVAPVVRELFERLRAWRTRCEYGGHPPRAAAAAAGGAR